MLPAPPRRVRPPRRRGRPVRSHHERHPAPRGDVEGRPLASAIRRAPAARRGSRRARDEARSTATIALRPSSTFYRDQMRRSAPIWDRHGGDVVAGLVLTGTRAAWSCSRARRPIATSRACSRRARDSPAARARHPRVRVALAAAHGSVAPRVRVPPDLEAAMAAAGIRFTIVDTHGVSTRAQALLSASMRPSSPSGGRLLRARRRIEPASVVSRRGLPRRHLLSRLLPRHRLRPPRVGPDGRAGADGSRLMTGLKYYRITGPGDRERALPARGREARAWEHAGNFVFKRRAGEAPVDHDDRPANRGRPLRRRALRPLVVRGAAVPRGGLPPAAEGEGGPRGADARAVPRPPPADHGRDAERVVVGRGRVWRGLGRTRGGVVVAPRSSCDALRELACPALPARGGDARPRARPGDPGAAAPAVVRLELHHQDRDHDAVRGGPHPHPPHRLRHLGHLVDSGVIPPDEQRWLEDLCGRDSFLAGMRGDELRRAFDPPG